MGPKPDLLIVDDEPTVLLTLRLIFEQGGYSVTTAESAAQALECLRRGSRVDAVLTDLCMESEDIGLEVAAEAARLRPRPIIIVLTGFSSVDNAQAALHLHVDHYALKPVDADELQNTVRRLLQARKELRVKAAE
jgi:DNA-binding NtrC family response regulator